LNNFAAEIVNRFKTKEALLQLFAVSALFLFILSSLVKIAVSFNSSHPEVTVPGMVSYAITKPQVLAAKPIETKAISSLVYVATKSTVQPNALALDRSLALTIKKHDNLLRIFKRVGLNARDAKAILSLKMASGLRDLHSGKKINLLVDHSGRNIKQLSYALNDTTLLTINNNNGFRPELTHLKVIERLTYISTVAKGSVAFAARRAGLPQKLTAKLASLVSNKTIFCNGVHRGDRLSMLLREYYVGNKKIRDGDIAALELATNKKAYRVLGFADENGVTNYYTPQGFGVNSPFMRYPLKFSRIGSKFTLARFHPILGIVRAHLGVDLVAPYGTPIKASSDGKVAFAGRDGGYGNMIMIQHGKYSTLYAHLSRFDRKIFSNHMVKQGQVIGYVGATGLATGPHLHYEFHVNGVHYDPLSVRLPPGEMIAAKYRGRFYAFSREMVAKLDLQRHTMLAMHQSSNAAAI